MRRLSAGPSCLQGLNSRALKQNRPRPKQASSQATALSSRISRLRRDLVQPKSSFLQQSQAHSAREATRQDIAQSEKFAGSMDQADCLARAAAGPHSREPGKPGSATTRFAASVDVRHWRDRPKAPSYRNRRVVCRGAHRCALRLKCDWAPCRAAGPAHSKARGHWR